MARAVFNFIDADDSGELEPEEVMLFNKTVIGASKDVKAKEDARASIVKMINQCKSFFSSIF